MWTGYFDFVLKFVSDDESGFKSAQFSTKLLVIKTIKTT